jgi:DNA-binding MarR family transcriptional regulator
MQNTYNESVGWIIYKLRFLLKNKLQKDLTVYDITTEQSSVLSFIYMNEGCNQKELAISSLKDRAALTRILDILEKKGLVRREKSTNDRREFLIYLTDNGRKVCSKLLTIVAQNTQEINSIFNDKELEQLKYLLNKLASYFKLFILYLIVDMANNVISTYIDMI